MRKITGLLFFVALTLLLSACSNKSLAGKPLTSFSFTDQNGQAFGTDELINTVWVANFVFTQCDTVCLPMMSETAAIQQQLKEQGLHAEFVSFSVDPAVDSPEVIKEYIGQYTDDESNWHMLTGYSQKEIETFARDTFKTIVIKPESSQQVLHGTNFYLVDQQGKIINEYNYIDSSYAEELIKDIEGLQKN
ncbi:SCO family protein [Sporosarcina sp. NPDC096371]|uniref:SCO family protein n=1 Tax=Sporosarcina sp. NPDC096371 TaxID=3364530 RepID=UPI00382148D1